MHTVTLRLPLLLLKAQILLEFICQCGAKCSGSPPHHLEARPISSLRLCLLLLLRLLLLLLLLLLLPLRVRTPC